MKIHIEIDCTPEEARRFLGLPDLRRMQDAVTAKIQEQALDAISKLTPAAMQAWLPCMELAGISRDTVEKAVRAAGESAGQKSRKVSQPESAPTGAIVRAVARGRRIPGCLPALSSTRHLFSFCFPRFPPRLPDATPTPQPIGVAR